MLNIFVPSINYIKSQKPFEQFDNFADNGNDNGNGNGKSNGKKKKNFTFDKFLDNQTDGQLGLFSKMHGLKIYEELCCGLFDFKSIGLFRCNDFQMAHIEHLDIIYARYVNEGIS